MSDRRQRIMTALGKKQSEARIEAEDKLFALKKQGQKTFADVMEIHKDLVRVPIANGMKWVSPEIAAKMQNG